MLGYNWLIMIYTDTTGDNLLLTILVKVVNLAKLLPLPPKKSVFFVITFGFFIAQTSRKV